MKRHTFWHQLLMIIVGEVNSFAWLIVGIVIVFTGSAVYKFTVYDVYRIVADLPLIIIGISLFLTKIYEIVIIMTDAKRLKGMCIYCHRND